MAITPWPILAQVAIKARELGAREDKDSLSPVVKQRLAKVYGAGATEYTPACLARYLDTATLYGVPDKVARDFLAMDYVPQGMQLRVHGAALECDKPGGPREVGVGGARGPGKSHATFAQGVYDCLRYPGLKILYLRKVSKNAKEQLGDLRRAVLGKIPHKLNKSTGTITFENGSCIVVGHFRTENDVDQYLGIEYDAVIIEEGTSLQREKHKALGDSTRTSKTGWRPRTYVTFNPGGVGHAYIKARFVEPWRRKEETKTRFVPGTVDDNVFVNAEYRENLEENTGWKLRAYRFGDWDIMAGQFFTNWNYNALVVPPDLWEPPRGDWDVWLCMDYGFRHYNAVYLMAKDNDGDTHVCDEYAERGLLPEQHTANIQLMLDRNSVSRDRIPADGFVAGGDVFKRESNGQSVAAAYDALGWPLTAGNTARINGAATVMQKFGDLTRENPVRPSIKISYKCKRLIECIPSLQHDPKNPEDVLKWDTDEDGYGGDDPYDAFKVGVMYGEELSGRRAYATRY